MVGNNLFEEITIFPDKKQCVFIWFDPSKAVCHKSEAEIGFSR